LTPVTLERSTTFIESFFTVLSSTLLQGLSHGFCHLASFDSIALWVRYLQWTQHPTYRHIVLNDSAISRDYVNNLGQAIITGAHVAARDLTAAVEDVQGTAHVGQPTVRDPASQGEEGHTELPSILLQPDAPNDALNPVDDARILLDAASAALQAVVPPPPASSPPSAEPITRISHSRTAVNEYTDFSRICDGAFVWQFPLGCPFSTVPSHDELRHLFMQADNRAADDDEFAMYMWNVRARADVCAGVVRGWRTNPRLFGQIRQLADDTDILQRISRARADPSSHAAQELLRQLRPVLMATSARVQFGNSGANSATFAKIVAQHRVTGNGALFVTVNPRLHEEQLPLRLTLPITSNLGNLDCMPPGYSFPNTAKARKAQLIEHTIGFSLGFMLFKESLFRYMFRLPLAPKSFAFGKVLPEQSHPRRGVLGELKVGTVAVESSASGLPHLHLEGTVPA
jgi:hypothetical protein